MRSWAVTLLTVAALAACSSPKPSGERAEANAAAKHTRPILPTLSDEDRRGLDAAIESLYASYRRPATVGPDEKNTDLDPANYSAATNNLIARWNAAAPKGEIDSRLQDMGWFCQCQDWPATGFKFLSKTIQPLPNGQIAAWLRFDLGDGMPQKIRILFVRENAAWKVADLFALAAPNGLIAQLDGDLARWKKK